MCVFALGESRGGGTKGEGVSIRRERVRGLGRWGKERGGGGGGAGCLRLTL